ncbi:MAG: hypothetical protein HY033_01575 [Ignavibacteriae bacterium]|nr:hypothetical protein [Ignavibacteria bacterium]MBI3363576.1 hypothetical protein [Ignavibacteriota bacterium]
MTKEGPDSKRDYEIYFLNATNNTMFAYWNALLTMNAIFIGVFSAIALFLSDRIVFIYLLILLCLISSALIIINYRETLEHYRFLGKLDEKSFLPEQSAKYLDDAATSHQKIKNREHAVVGILIAQGILIVILLVFKYLASRS